MSYSYRVNYIEKFGKHPEIFKRERSELIAAITTITSATVEQYSAFFDEIGVQYSVIPHRVFSEYYHIVLKDSADFNLINLTLSPEKETTNYNQAIGRILRWEHTDTINIEVKKEGVIL